MVEAAAPWWIIGGAAAVLHGVGKAPGDVDVLLAEEDARVLLPRTGLTPVAGPAHPRFRSVLFARWLQPPMPVEFMAGFALDGVPVRPVTRMAVMRGESRVFVPARDELARMMRAIGRRKDLVRAGLLVG